MLLMQVLLLARPIFLLNLGDHAGQLANYSRVGLVSVPPVLVLFLTVFLFAFHIIRVL